MNKGVLIGGGLGLLILLLLGGYWLSVRTPESSTPVVQQQPGSGANAPLTTPAPVPSGASGSAVPDNSANSAAGTASTDPASQATSPPAPWSASPSEPTSGTPSPALTRDERRKARAEVRAKMSELLAKGQNATPEDTQAFLNDVERVGKGLFDPRYFSTMREMVQYSARTQELSKALAQIGSSKAPADEKKRVAILAELRDLSDRISNGAAALQSFAKDTAEGKKP